MPDDIVTRMNLSVVNDLRARWGGRFPTWDEFKLRVRLEVFVVTKTSESKPSG
jgi:hypothetical protein